MAENLVFPLDPSEARKLVSDALVPHGECFHVRFARGTILGRRKLDLADLHGCVIVIGAFDGFHKGHAKLVEEARLSARSNGRPLVALTFFPDPSEILGRREGRLLDEGQRADALLGAGADAVVSLLFDSWLMNLQKDAFVDFLVQYFAPFEIHVGSNFRFGANAEGSAAGLQYMCGAKGIEVGIHGLLEIDGQPVSATRIRKLVAQGRIEEAASLMGRYPNYFGLVAHGRGEGADLGFATANLEVMNQVLPAPGVYAGYTVIKGTAWPTAANAGAPASFAGGAPNLIEAHLVGFDGDIYGRTARFVPFRFLREERCFASREELVSTVRDNIEWVSKNLGTTALEVRA